MKLEIVKLSLGPLPNNVYLLGDQDTGSCAVIDPGFESQAVLDRLEAEAWEPQAIWLTHGHFDHMAGAAAIAQAFDSPLPIGLHPGDLDWYHRGGGAAQFGLSIPQPPEPAILFAEGMPMRFSEDGPPAAVVRHAPGHSPGHVMFYCEALGALFCGDVIFRMGVGRTDLAGGNLDSLRMSIRRQVFTLPDETRLLPGHGPESTVGFEKEHNPFLQS